VAQRRLNRLRSFVGSDLCIHEDAFGTPPQARGGMMCVAGAEDELDPGEELLTDDEANSDENIDTTMKGPVYPEGRSLRISIGSLRLLIGECINGNE